MRKRTQSFFALAALLVFLAPAYFLRTDERLEQVAVDQPQGATLTYELDKTEARDLFLDQNLHTLSSRSTSGAEQLVDPIPTKPLHTTTSYYMNTADPNKLIPMGRAAGEKTVGLNGSADDLIVLAFGAPKVQDGLDGTIIFRAPGASSSGFASTSEIERGSQAFISNYLNGANPKARLNLVLGTSNWGTQVTRQHGIAWARMVNNVSAWIAEAGFADRASVFGGNDIEADWNEAAVTRAWVDSYLSVEGSKLFNFGDAAGCPWNDKGALTCNNGWTVNDVWYVSSGAGEVQPIPQIYNPTMAKQWYQLKRYSLTKTKDGFKPMEIAGVLTMDGDCRQEGGCGSGFDLKPEEGYRQLSGLLNGSVETAQNLRFATDIKRAWLP